MMENEKDFNPHESLALIESMINKAKNRFNENGHLYLLWGWTIFFCCIFHFVFAWQQWLAHPEIVWCLTWAVVIYQIIFIAKKKKKEAVRSYADEITGSIWISFSIMMFLMVFVLSKTNSFEKMYPMFLVLYGMPTFLSGVMMRFPALKLGGISCWILAIISVYIPIQFQLLLLAVAVVTAWIIPGYLLRAKHKKENL